MAFGESFLIALFLMLVVFSVLGILWVIIRIFSSIIMLIEKSNASNSSKQ